MSVHGGWETPDDTSEDMAFESTTTFIPFGEAEGEAEGGLHTPDDNSEDPSDTTTTMIPFGEDSSEKFPEPMENIPENTSEDIPEDIPENIPENISEDIPENISYSSTIIPFDRDISGISLESTTFMLFKKDSTVDLPPFVTTITTNIVPFASTDTDSKDMTTENKGAVTDCDEDGTDLSKEDNEAVALQGDKGEVEDPELINTENSIETSPVGIDINPVINQNKVDIAEDLTVLVDVCSEGIVENKTEIEATEELKQEGEGDAAEVLPDSIQCIRNSDSSKGPEEPESEPVLSEEEKLMKFISEGYIQQIVLQATGNVSDVKKKAHDVVCEILRLAFGGPIDLFIEDILIPKTESLSVATEIVETETTSTPAPDPPLSPTQAPAPASPVTPASPTKTFLGDVRGDVLRKSSKQKKISMGDILFEVEEEDDPSMAVAKRVISRKNSIDEKRVYEKGKYGYDIPIIVNGYSFIRDRNNDLYFISKISTIDHKDPNHKDYKSYGKEKNRSENVSLNLEDKLQKKLGSERQEVSSYIFFRRVNASNGMYACLPTCIRIYVCKH